MSTNRMSHFAAAAISSLMFVAITLGSTASAHAQRKTVTKEVTVSKTRGNQKAGKKTVVTKTKTKTATNEKKATIRKTTTTTTVRRSTPGRVVTTRRPAASRPRYERVVLGGKSYFRREGRYYRQVTQRGQVRYVALERPPVGHRVSQLPRGSVRVVRDGKSRWRHDGAYYTRVSIGGGRFSFEITSW